MPRIRTVKPEFFRSPSTAKVDPYTRLFYQALWCWADDFGIGETNIYGLLGFAFPDSDGFSAQDLRRFCADVAQHFEIEFYIVRERHYYAIKNWTDHQKTERREDRRKHPTPDDPDAMPDLQFQRCAENPAQNLRKTGAGTGEQGNRGTGEREQEPPYPPGDEIPPPAPRTNRGGKELDRVRAMNLTARSVDAYKIAEAFSRSLPVPIERGHLADVGKSIDKCLKSEIPAQAIADGLRAWSASNSWSPTQIPAFVHKANNHAPTTAGKPTQKAQGIADAGAELLAEMERA